MTKQSMLNTMTQRMTQNRKVDHMARLDRKKTHSPFQSIDWPLLILVLCINGLGLLMINSVSIQLNQPGLLMKQFIATIIGLLCMTGILFLDYKDLKVLGIPIYIGTTFLLILVLVSGHGLEETGTKGWLLIGPVSIQPSEYGKISLVLMTAFLLDRFREKKNIINLLLLLIVMGLPMVLIMMQPDFGTTIVYVFMLLCMLYVYGIRYRYIFISLIVLVVSLPLLWFNVLVKVLKDYQILRIMSFLNPAAYSRDAAYQVNMAIRSIGSGQLFGRGLQQGQAAVHVPAAETDMIFSVLGEELGFIGAAALVGLFALLLLRLIFIARFAKDLYGSYIVIGLMAIYLFHFVENVGMNIGLMPVTGIPLPFVSYGGTSVIANYIAIGIICSISMRRQRPMFDG